MTGKQICPLLMFAPYVKNISDTAFAVYHLYRFCKPIMTKPKPAPKPQTPPTPPTETSAPQTPEQQSHGAEAAGEPTSEPTTEGGATESAGGEQMETDKPEGAGAPSA